MEISNNLCELDVTLKKVRSYNPPPHLIEMSELISIDVIPEGGEVAAVDAVAGGYVRVAAAIVHQGQADQPALRLTHLSHYL